MVTVGAWWQLKASAPLSTVCFFILFIFSTKGDAKKPTPLYATVIYLDCFVCLALYYKLLKPQKSARAKQNCFRCPIASVAKNGHLFILIVILRGWNMNLSWEKQQFYKNHLIIIEIGPK